jgi:predicted nucleic acid-binding protein
MVVEETSRALAELAAFNIEIDVAPDTAGHDELLNPARLERLPVYGALYLWHALRHHLSLATRDAELIAAAGRNGLPVLDMRS